MCPDIGGAQTLVLGQEVRIPGENRDLRRRSALQRVGHGRRVGRGHGDAVDLLGDEVGDDLRFLVAAAMFARPDVQALDRAGELLLRLLATGKRLVEEGVIGVLWHERKSVGVGGSGRS